MEYYLKSTWLLFMLLNPFLMSVYLASLIEKFDGPDFARIMKRAHVIALFIFVIFAIAGESIFINFFNVRFSSFLIFGGIIFLMIGIKSVFHGPGALIETRGEPAHISGAAAMPFMIGPGTISASIMAGAHQSSAMASLSVGTALILSYLSIVWFKQMLDSVKQRSETLLQRYLEVTGKIIALFTGTYAVEMIIKGREAVLLGHN